MIKMDKPRHFKEVELNYRKLYGELFAALIATFPTTPIQGIEDAIQNAFYKSLKSWKPDKTPRNPLHWLYIVSRNDLLSQLKKAPGKVYDEPFGVDQFQPSEDTGSDLRIEILHLIASLKNLSVKSKILFSLKNVFGLSVKEIQQNTLIGEEAIYKNLKRTNTRIEQSRHKEFPGPASREKYLPTILEILYSIFNLGFDDLQNHKNALINKDITLEACALLKQLILRHPDYRTKNLLALFCLHLARMDSRTAGDKLIPFFEQDRRLWNQSLIQTGIGLLTKPPVLDRYYLEALIVSMHMLVEVPDSRHWEEIDHCYQLLRKVNDSPIIRINWAYSLARAGKQDEALKILEEAKKELPADHFYLHLVEAEILRHQDPQQSAKLLSQALALTEHPLRKKLIREKIQSLQ